ncbi:MAG: FGGY family carbohydrate kinase [Caldicoprobacterales bacterium]
MLVLGLDIGTTTVCGVLWDSETEKPVKTLSYPNPGNLKGRFPWEHMQDPKKILECVHDVLDTFKRSGKPKAIGITGQMHGILYTDRKGQPVTPLYTWQDNRGAQIYDDNISYAEYLSIKTGTEIYPGYGLSTHMYNVKNNLVPGEAHKLCTIGDYVAMALSGMELPVTDPTNAASLGGFDLIKGEFVTKYCWCFTKWRKCLCKTSTVFR